MVKLPVPTVLGDTVSRSGCGHFWTRVNGHIYLQAGTEIVHALERNVSFCTTCHSEVFHPLGVQLPCLMRECLPHCSPGPHAPFSYHLS